MTLSVYVVYNTLYKRSNCGKHQVSCDGVELLLVAHMRLVLF